MAQYRGLELAAFPCSECTDVNDCMDAGRCQYPTEQRLVVDGHKPRKPVKAARKVKPDAERITPEQVAAAGTEHAHQTALFVWVTYSPSRNDNEGVLRPIDLMPELRWLFAIPNGGLRDKATANKLKAEGVKTGVADLCWPLRRRAHRDAINLGARDAMECYCCLYIEMKRPSSKGKRKGVVEPEQEEFAAFVKGQGYIHAVAYGWQEAVEIITAYYRYGP